MTSGQLTNEKGYSYRELRPLRSDYDAQPRERRPFPIYENLAARLRGDARKQPLTDNDVARIMATLAGYAYSDHATVATMATRLGLEENRCTHIWQVVDAMFICSHAFVVQSRDRSVAIVCYRGTEPTSAINWLTNFTIEPTRIVLPEHPALRRGGREPMWVHGGFYRNVRSTRWQIGEALQETQGTLKALYVTGHSLGGAMAVILSLLMHIDDDYAWLRGILKGVYTFGQPMVGNKALAAACDGGDIGRSIRRYVYRRDIVPQLPPRETDQFVHFGQEYRYAGRGPWKKSRNSRPTSGLSIAELLPDAVSRDIPLLRHLHFGHSLVDHGPQYYIQALTDEGTATEFGDRYLGTVAAPT